MTNGTTSREGAVETDRMQRAQASSAGIWKGTSWLLTLLGGGAFFTLGLRIQNSSQGFLWSPVFALAAILIGGGAFLAIKIVTTSRIRRPVEAARQRRLAYTIIFVAFFVQIAAIAAAPVFQGVAVYQTLQANEPRKQADFALAQRLKAYSADASRLSLVVGYCKQHETDAQVSDTFLQDCSEFLQSTPPTPEQAGGLAASLS